MTACRSCGATHPDDTRLCPRTREPVDQGPCGTRIDRYDIERLLGTGGFGGVYVAMHSNLGQRVAMKLLKERVDSDPTVRERFLREARAAAAISSPHVVRVTDFGETPSGEAFLVMELLDGRDLDAMLRSAPGPQPESRSIAIMLEILEGLSAAHRAGVVHRDLKPANVFLARDAGREVSKLVDFGISHARLRPEDRTLTAAGMILGTPAYMAPEQIQGRPVDERVDIYAAGVVLYQMLSGTLPHEAETFERLVVRVCTEEPRPVRSVAPQVPIALAQVVDRAVAREPAARFATADAFADALRTVAGIRGNAITSPLGAARADHFAATEMQQTPVSVRPAAQLPAYIPTSVQERTYEQTGAMSSARAPTGLVPAHPSASIAVPALIVGGLLVACLAVVILAVVALALMPREAPQTRIDATLSPAPTRPQGMEPALVTPTAPTAPTASTAPTAPSAPTAPPAPPPIPTPPIAPEARTGSTNSSGVHWGEARALGGIDTAAARGILRRIAPACEECRVRGRATHVSAQLMFGAGEIRIAQANPNEPNDEEPSRCVANRFREAASGVHLADSGILIVSAELDAL